MSKMNTNPARGTQDTLPSDYLKRQQVIGVIEEVYQRFGFVPMDTPALENLDTFKGAYGEEGDKLTFKVLKRGRKLDQALEASEGELADMGLRYDHTVPLARFVAQNLNDLPRYFKRYQIAPVWRADRPQKGRFREFHQCDLDLVGSSSVVAEIEVLSAVLEVLSKLGLKGFTVRVNHRELLEAILDHCDIDSSLQQGVMVALDKLDKIGMVRVLEEMVDLGVSMASVEALTPLLTDPVPLEELETLLGASKALTDLKTLFSTIRDSPLELDLTLARGLSYYTGMVFEITHDEFQGSLGGGGRYDNLIGRFAKREIPAVGFSFGLERLLLVLEEQGLLKEPEPPTRALVTFWSEELLKPSLNLVEALRKQGISATLYPEPRKLEHQVKYAKELGVPFLIILGPDEIAKGTVKIENMVTLKSLEVPCRIMYPSFKVYFDNWR